MSHTRAKSVRQLGASRAARSAQLGPVEFARMSTQGFDRGGRHRSVALVGLHASYRALLYSSPCIAARCQRRAAHGHLGGSCSAAVIALHARSATHAIRLANLREKGPRMDDLPRRESRRAARGAHDGALERGRLALTGSRAATRSSKNWSACTCGRRPSSTNARSLPAPQVGRLQPQPCARHRWPVMTPHAPTCRAGTAGARGWYS